jgi:hypothetical protein
MSKETVELSRTFRNVATDEVVQAYWTRVIDGQLVDLPVLRCENGRWLNPNVWIQTGPANIDGKEKFWLLYRSKDHMKIRMRV